MYASAVYISSRFCNDVEAETAAFKELLGDQFGTCMQGMYDHKSVNKDRFKEYKADNRYGTTNVVALDFAQPVIADAPKPFTLIIELQEAKWPEKR